MGPAPSESPRSAGTRRARSLLRGEAELGDDVGAEGDGIEEAGPRDAAEDAEDARAARRRRTEPERPVGPPPSVSDRPRVATDDEGWVPVVDAVKEEPRDTMQMDTVRMDTLPVDPEEAAGASGSAAPPPAPPAVAADEAQDDGFFDDME